MLKYLIIGFIITAIFIILMTILLKYLISIKLIERDELYNEPGFLAVLAVIAALLLFVWPIVAPLVALFLLALFLYAKYLWKEDE
jgi:hypothetical protein